MSTATVPVFHQNGATEVWPGSHHVSCINDHAGGDSVHDPLRIQKGFIEERRKHSPPIQARTTKGSIIIRDLRLWHAGMPNHTDERRIMLAFVAQPSWFQGRSKIILPKNVKDMVESWSEMLFDAEYVDSEVDHRKLSSADVDFDGNSHALAKYRDVLSRWPEYKPRWN